MATESPFATIAFSGVCPLTWKAQPNNRTTLPTRHQTCTRSLRKRTPSTQTSTSVQSPVQNPRTNPACNSTNKDKHEETAEGVVRKFWEITATGKFTQTASLFTEDAIYNDTLYAEPFKGLSEISTHLHNMESAFPPGLVFILDSVAAADRTVGARWHAETDRGQPVPFTRGASMYTLRQVVRHDGSVCLLIEDAWDFPETPFKVAAIVLPVLRFASRVMRLFK